MTASSFDLRVRSLSLEADAILSVELDDPTGADLPGWEPGAHIDVQFAPGLVRQYSLCGNPGEPSAYRIAVLRESQSRGGSSYVHDRLRPGDLVSVRALRNNFPLVVAQRYIFVAGGIGITPLLPMIHQIQQSEADWHLLYLGRRRGSMAFLSDPAITDPRCSVITKNPDVADQSTLDSALSAVDDDVAVYCCGPERLLDDIEGRAALWPAGALHVERFHPKMEQTGASTDNAGFVVECYRSGREVEVGADETVLSALRAAGLEVSSSCEEGVCGACELKVLAGDVEHRDSVLTDAERQTSDTMMVCCSRARSPRLVLDI